MAARGTRMLLPAIALAVGTTLVGCGISIPADPDGTLERVRGGTLEAGLSAEPPWTDVVGGEPSGLEVALVEEFADGLGATVEWRVGGEGALIGRLGRGELDLVVGGLTDASPWTGEAVLTKPFVEARGEDGTLEKHVMAAPLGENAFLLELERFLLEEDENVP